MFSSSLIGDAVIVDMVDGRRIKMTELDIIHQIITLIMIVWGIWGKHIFGWDDSD